MPGGVVPLHAVDRPPAFRLVAPPTELPPEVLAQALDQIGSPTPAMTRAAEKLAEELDLLCLPPPSYAAIFTAMLAASRERLGSGARP